MAASDELSTFMAASDELPTVQFDASHPLGRFLVSTGLPSRAWKASIAAHKSEKPFIFYEIDHMVYFAFTGSDAVDDILTVFGEENIMGNHLFTNNDNGEGEPALVNSGLLRGFLNLVQNSDFQEKNAAARHTLMNTGRIELRPSLNSAQLHVQSAKIQGARVELEWYKTSCERDGIGYYDSFKKPSKPKDFRANIDRIKISRFWDDFVQMVEMNELVDDELKWVYTGAYYRQLVEPLDIAFYYRSGKQKKQGHYLQGGRHRRYEILEKWFEDIDSKNERVRRTRLAVVTQDSCFWARLEEAKDWLDIIKEERDIAVNAELMNKIEGFVNHVHELVKARDISRDVLLEEASFIKWWKEYRRMHTDFLSFSSHPHPTQLQLTEIENEMNLCIKSDPMIKAIL